MKEITIKIYLNENEESMLDDYIQKAQKHFSENCGGEADVNNILSGIVKCALKEIVFKSKLSVGGGKPNVNYDKEGN